MDTFAVAVFPVAKPQVSDLDPLWDANRVTSQNADQYL